MQKTQINSPAIHYPQAINTYLQVKKLQVFTVLKRLCFSGQLIWSSPGGHRWILFFNQGQVVYGTGGLHPNRQWYRQVRAYLPHLDLGFQTLQRLILDQPSYILPNCWDYNLLHTWFTQGHLSVQACREISAKIVADILFDVIQVAETPYQLIRHPAFSPQQVPIHLNEAELLPFVTELWQAWGHAGLAAYSPNLAPIILHLEPIRTEVSPRVYKSMVQVLDGQRSLRDLAVQLGQDVLALTQALQPFLQAGWINLVKVADLPILAGGGVVTSPIAQGDRPRALCVWMIAPWFAKPWARCCGRRGMTLWRSWKGPG
ncbi:MAG: hypothetical protein HC922_07835 [Leptolyngbyaceae cyanobacterium SM2_3_12]|nr:hypothetical protein [Leptolyngbyaceae cyanobacterium SM2_3_12]